MEGGYSGVRAVRSGGGGRSDRRLGRRLRAGQPGQLARDGRPRADEQLPPGRDGR